MAPKKTLMPSAHTITIKDLIDGEYKTPANEPAFLETAWGLKVFKVNLVATVIDNYVSNDEKFASITLDDGTGVIRSKAFQNTRVIADIKAGTIIQFIGWVRNYNDELYLVPEIVTLVTNYDKLSLMKLEAHTFKKKYLNKKDEKPAIKTEIKESKEQSNEKINKETIKTQKPTEPINKESQEPKTNNENTNIEDTTKEPNEKQIREKVVNTIESLDKGDGVDYADILKNVNLELHLVEKAIDELLSEGSCYEPRAGKLKVL